MDITGSIRMSVPNGKSGMASLKVQDAPLEVGHLSIAETPPPGSPLLLAKLAAKMPVTVLNVAPNVAR